ncbi:MAG: precorrin-3B C(17)-methyltransferase [Nitrospirae bacterium]|nr:precorrin-3B C(17)-methyltransferase [Nitrospirota bacterium]
MSTGSKKRSQKSEVRSNPPIPPLNKGGQRGVIAILYITDNGHTLAQEIRKLYPDARVLKFKADAVSNIWEKNNALIFIMASGIVVRSIAPLIKDKKTDPAVVVLDEKGRYAVSLLSGHLGGANKLVKEIADFLKGAAVITTASDVQGKVSLDLWAKENDLYIEDFEKLKKLSSKIVNGRKIRVWSAHTIEMPDEFTTVDSAKDAELIISHKLARSNALFLRPKTLVAGIGCNRGTSAAEIESAIKKVLLKKKLSFHSIRNLATIDIKKNEKGLADFAGENKLDIQFFSKEDLNSAVSALDLAQSKTVEAATGALAVAEPAALLSSGADTLLVPKQKTGNVTVAVAEVPTPNPQPPTPKLFIVGTGPGNIEHITPRAQEAISQSDVIVGYGTYLDLVPELIKGKKVVSTGMTKEVDRCKKAVELALQGKTVAVISGGDPGIYAMAGLVFEILRTQNTEHRAQTEDSQLKIQGSISGSHSSLSVEVIPGISALNACAARLGAPLMHDFASISLSDRLTPWEVIEKRLEAAAAADFVIALYNPKSKGRQEHINRAQEIILKHRSPETPVGIVKGAMRENEEIVITDLQNMLGHDIDMQTTVIIGNSKTFVWNNRIITPRGYEKKFEI